LICHVFGKGYFDLKGVFDKHLLSLFWVFLLQEKKRFFSQTKLQKIKIIFFLAYYHNSILGYSLKFIFFQNKNKK
jgi:hypothetical protein